MFDSTKFPTRRRPLGYGGQAKFPTERTFGWLMLLGLALVLGCTSVVRAQEDAALPALIELLGQTDDAQFQLDLLNGMSEGLRGRRNVKMPAGWEAVAAKLQQSQNPKVRELAQNLSLTFGSASALAALRRKLADPTSNSAARLSALEALLAARDPELASMLRPLLKEPALRGPALRGLAAYDNAQTAAAILEVYPSLNVAEKRDALNTLVSRATFARALLDAVQNRIIPARDVTADVVRQLRLLKDDHVQEQIGKVWGVARESQADKLAEIARFKTMLTAGKAGQPSAGRAVFARTCQQCHTLFEVGGKVGPDITGSNRGDLDYLLQNVLDPNAVIPNDYRTSTLETKDDRFIVGIVTRQDDNAVTIVTANETLIVPRAEVVELRQGEVSMMPEGLIEVLSEGEVRDLIAYLRSPAQVPMQARPDNVEGLFNGRDLIGWEGDTNLWSVVDGEIVGRTTGLKRNEWLSGPLLLGDFRLVLEVMLKPNNENSGIQFRSQRLESGEVKGYQADVGEGWWGKLYEEHGRGLLWKEPGDHYIKAGQWNLYEIVALGSRIRTSINGQPCVDLDDPQGAREGIVAFQLHAGGALEVRYRRIKLELK